MKKEKRNGDSQRLLRGRDKSKEVGEKERRREMGKEIWREKMRRTDREEERVKRRLR